MDVVVIMTDLHSERRGGVGKGGGATRSGLSEGEYRCTGVQSERLVKMFEVNQSLYFAVT